MNKMILLVLALGMWTSIKAQNIDEDLRTLDQTVAQKEVYERAKQNEIDNTKQLLSNCVTPIDKYNCYEQLCQKYLKWNLDSASYYAGLLKNLAFTYHWDDLYVRACIYQAYIQVICGDLLGASTAIQQLPNIQNIAKDNQIKMAVLLLEYSLKQELGKVKVWKMQANICRNAWNKYSPYLLKSDWRYAYYQVMLLRQGNLLEMVREIKCSNQPSLKVAALAAACSRIYYGKKDYHSFLHYLILSATNDIQCANHEASSLLFLINTSHISLQPRQAYNYAMLCTENAQIFKDQGRSLDIVKAHAKITKSYQEQLQKKTNVLYLVICLLVLAIIAVMCLLRKNKKKSKEQGKILEQLEESNQERQVMIDRERAAQIQLQAANELLKKEIYYHNQNFFNVYHLVSKYISDVQNFKKTAYNLLTAGKYDKARRELHSNSYSEKYLKSFFEHFDQAFLLSHPDFVERFNALLRPESRIEPPAANVLTPELRIYALVSIGITDSVSIAQFLHYSPQTVYNYRFKIRHAACVDERNFAETVAKMYDESYQKVQEAKE